MSGRICDRYNCIVCLWFVRLCWLRTIGMGGGLCLECFRWRTLSGGFVTGFGDVIRLIIEMGRGFPFMLGAIQRLGCVLLRMLVRRGRGGGRQLWGRGRGGGR